MKRFVVLLIELMFAIMVVVGFVLFALNTTPEQRPSRDIVGFVGTTILVFGLLLRETRPHWKQAATWAFASIALMVHTAIWIFLLKRSPELPFLVFGLIAFAEFVFLFRLFGWLHSRHLIKRAEPDVQ